MPVAVADPVVERPARPLLAGGGAVGGRGDPGDFVAVEAASRAGVEAEPAAGVGGRQEGLGEVEGEQEPLPPQHQAAPVSVGVMPALPEARVTPGALEASARMGSCDAPSQVRMPSRPARKTPAPPTLVAATKRKSCACTHDLACCRQQRPACRCRARLSLPCPAAPPRARPRARRRQVCGSASWFPPSVGRLPCRGREAGQESWRQVVGRGTSRHCRAGENPRDPRCRVFRQFRAAPHPSCR